MNWLVKKLLKFTGSQKFLSIQLDITNACNLNCLHCYQTGHSTSEDLSFRDWCRILDQYGALAGKLQLKPHFCLSGGEPTLSGIFSDMLKEIHLRWPDAGISVLTNGVCISPQKIGEFARYKTDVQISIDGPDAEKHDHVRGQGNFKRVMDGVKNFRNAGITPTFQAVLSFRTSPWITDFFELAGAAGAAAMNFTRFIAQGKGKCLSASGGDRPLNEVELKEAYSMILAASRKSGIPTNTNLPLMALISPELGAHGKFGFQGLVIDFRGNLKVSSRADFRLGNVFESGLEELFLRHPVMKALREGKISGCSSCRFYDRCGGDRNASYAAYGDFLRKDPACWL